MIDFKASKASVFVCALLINPSMEFLLARRSLHATDETRWTWLGKKVAAKSTRILLILRLLHAQ
jgi:hypothetical protein